MTDEQINALAREYASRATYPFENKTAAKPAAIDMLRYLSEHYCIVEKGKLTEEYHEAKFTCGNVDPCSETFATSLAQKSLLERLFPELFKTEEK